jgi:hypothetical protein
MGGTAKVFFDIAEVRSKTFDLDVTSGVPLAILIPNMIQWDRIHVWWYGERTADSGARYISRIGTISVHLRDLTTVTRPMLDAALNRVAVITLSTSFVGIGGEYERQERCSDKALEKKLPDFSVIHRAAITRLHDSLMPTNVKEITHYLFDLRTFPCGQLPAWSFAFRITSSIDLIARTQSNEIELLLLRLYYMACFNLFRDPEELYEDEKAPASLLSEIMGEMAAIVPRAMLWKPDSSPLSNGMDEADDDWTNIPDTPIRCRRVAAFDCEDGAVFAVEILRLLKAATLTDAALIKLQQNARDYVLLFCVCTLVSGDKIVWHALEINLPVVYIEALVSGDHSTYRKSDLPPFTLVETTNYSASCVNYESQFDSSPLPLNLPFRHISKFPSYMVRNNYPYQHIQSLHCPEWVRSKGVAQYELSYKGRLGVPFEMLMNYSDSKDIELHPVNVDHSVRQVEIAQAKGLPLYEPLKIPSPVTPVQRWMRGPLMPRVAPYIDITMRTADATPENIDLIKQAAAAANMRRELEVITQQVVEGLETTRVLSW